ncbi:MAG: hypothetical protein HWN66_13615 [Candidatus Helarchaeota archaeon]|nr:hypothetical protein [Candidatus Helarchaeota archaeon]
MRGVVNKTGRERFRSEKEKNIEKSKNLKSDIKKNERAFPLLLLFLCLKQELSRVKHID